MTPLTQRELDLLRLVARGAGVGEIAVAFDLTTATVETMTSRVIEKLDAKTRPHAVAQALRLGLIS